MNTFPVPVLADSRSGYSVVVRCWYAGRELSGEAQESNTCGGAACAENIGGLSRRGIQFEPNQMIAGANKAQQGDTLIPAATRRRNNSAGATEPTGDSGRLTISSAWRMAPQGLRGVR